jgi:hypothetical protein
MTAERRAASAQATRIRLEHIEHGVAHFDDGHACAVLELTGGGFGPGDEARQEVVVAGLAAFLNALGFPVQVLVRAVPIDLRGYLERVEERARSGELNETLAALARDHAAFVRGLARQRTLLERRLYLVVPIRIPRQRGRGRLGWLPFPRPARRVDAVDDAGRPAAGGPPDQSEGAIVRQLAFRCDELAAQLRRVGVEARGLDNLGLAELYLACWSPERARTQRLRQELRDYTALVVAARPRDPAR